MEYTAAAVLAAIATVYGVGKNFSEAEKRERIVGWAKSLRPGITPDEGIRAVYSWSREHDTPPRPSNVNALCTPEDQPLFIDAGDGVSLAEFLAAHPEERPIFERVGWVENDCE